MQSLTADLRYAVRQMINSPGFALTAVISLALGIGATTAVFSIIYAALINPYPYPHADQIMRLAMETKAGRGDWITLNGYQVQQLRKSPVVASVLAMDYHAMTLTGRDYPENVNVVKFIANGFHDLGLPPLLGRGLLPSDAPDGQEPQPVTVLSYKFWQEHYLGNADVVGKKIRLDQQPYLIVGVAAPRFTWYNPDVWVPLCLTQDPLRTFIVDIFLKPGVTNAAADAALEPLMHEFAHQMPKHYPEHFKVRVEGLNEWVTRSISGTLYLLLGAVVLLLGIGCGNVSILLMARGTARQHELAVRSAIGANRRRLIVQLLTESLLLAVTGAGIGVALSFGILAGIKTLLPRYAFAPEVVVRVNVPVLLFSVGVALLTGVLFGLWPAIQLSRTQLGEALQTNSRRMAGSVRSRRTHQALVAGQIALTLLLLAGAGAAMDGFLQTIRAPLGYDPHNVVSIPIPLRDNSYTSWAARANYFEELRKAVSEVPGVKLAVITHNGSLPSGGWDARFELRGKTTSEQPVGLINFVSPGYFAALHIALLQGRVWDGTENRNAAHVAVINRTLAQRYYPHGDALEHMLKLTQLDDRPPRVLTAPQIADSWLTIVGIVDDVRNDGLKNPAKPAIYVPYTLSMSQFTQIFVKSAVAPMTLAHTIRKQLTRVNPEQQTYDPQALEAWISEEPEWQQEHLTAWIFGIFAALALVLAAVGLYSMVSYAVAQRTNEFGIRMALGAQRGDVMRSVFAANLASVSAGVLAGLTLALALSGVIQKWAGGRSGDPVILVAGTLLLSVVSAIACGIPARHATEIDPMTALRFE